MKTLCTTHKIKLYARRANHTKLETALNTHRVLYNSALTQRRIAFKSHGKSINYNYQSAELTDLRKHDPYWQAQHRNLAIGTLRRLDRSFQNMFRRIKRGEKAGYPRYIKYGQFRTLSVNENNVTRTMLKYKDDDHKRGYIKVKGVGTFWFKHHRTLPNIDKLASIHITKTARRIQACLVFAIDDVPSINEHPVKAVGIDMGVSTQAALSDNTLVNCKKEKINTKKRLQQKRSRCKKGSNNSKKLRHQYARECQRIREREHNAIHRFTTYIVNNYDFIVVEKLQIKNLTKSPKGTIENPGKNVRQKAGLNRNILANKWGLIISQLTYKAERAGTTLVMVDPRNTSQMCSNCSNIVRKSLRERTHDCNHCWLSIDRDVNAAINIRDRGWNQVGRAVPDAWKPCNTDYGLVWLNAERRISF